MNKRRRYKAKARRARRQQLAVLCSRVPRTMRGFIADEIGVISAWQWRMLERLAGSSRRLHLHGGRRGGKGWLTAADKALSGVPVLNRPYRGALNPDVNT